MGKNLLAVFLLLVLCIGLTFPSSVCAGQKIPEKLVYSLSWTGINVGTATQEIVDEGDTRRIISTARSNDWLSKFFPVDDRTESVLLKKGTFPGEPRNFKMLFREGSRTRDREISFNIAARVANFHDRKNGERVAVPINEDTFDIYSSFYYVRHQPLEPGRSFYINVLDSKKLHRIEVRVLKRERVSVPAGEFDTVKVEPMVKPVGVFEGKRGAYIWLTDDSRRIPVKAQTKVAVGSVTAVLTGGIY
ncbi:MAG TPA: DUF3108 domain-containing protein [Geobacteraceae bacterium]|nr:DUF3108 domain-containing protein [Geobacteraceae bacterium]